MTKEDVIESKKHVANEAMIQENQIEGDDDMSVKDREAEKKEAV